MGQGTTTAIPLGGEIIAEQAIGNAGTLNLTNSLFYPNRLYRIEWTGTAAGKLNISNGVVGMIYNLAVKSNATAYVFAVGDVATAVRTPSDVTITPSATGRIDFYQLYCTATNKYTLTYAYNYNSDIFA